MTATSSRHAVVIGAGIAGLHAAITLAKSGMHVTVVDKGRSVGGRLATRRIGTATLDHGAQFFTVRTERLAEHTDRWIKGGAVRAWCYGFGDSDDGFPRYVGTNGMTSVAKAFAAEATAQGNVQIRCASMAFSVQPNETLGAWTVMLDTGETLRADALIITTPLPQTYSLMVTAGVELPEKLRGMEYDRTIALLACLDREPTIGRHGGRQGAPTELFSFIAANQAKHVSNAPALTVHANASWSETHWAEPTEHLRDLLLDAATAVFDGAHVETAQVKKWRFATPRTPWPEPTWSVEPHSDNVPAPLALAGDAFAGPRVEGAYLSGHAAATRIVEACA